jgi:urease accessory protein
MNSLSQPQRGYLWSTAVIFISLVAAPLAQAHPGHGFDNGIVAGLMHPLTGWDHLVAMIAVGLWAASLGGKARWLLPAAFVGYLALGAVLGHLVGPIPGTEQAIVASLFFLGLMMATAFPISVPAGAAMTGAFALFHGLAHGAEIPISAQGVAFGIGFICTSVLLLAAGGILGRMGSKHLPLIPRLAGGVLAVVAVIVFAQS